MKLIITSALLLLLTSNTFATSITVVFMADYAPVSFLSPKDGRAIGITPNIIEEAFAERPNLKIKLVGLPWVRAQEMVKKGEADAMVASITPERLTYSTASKVPAFCDSYRPYTYLGHPRMKELMNIKSRDDLKDFSLCDYLGNGWTKNYLEGKVAKIEYGRSISMKIGMLAAHRCDLIIDQGFLVRSTAKNEHFDDKIVELPVTFVKSSFHLLVSKKSSHQELLSIFDKKVKDMRDNGRIKKIIQEWTPELQRPNDLNIKK